MSNFDVVVVGAGPGGYVAAIRCAQLGLSTLCVDSWHTSAGAPSLGGTCLNVGCIPSKALLDSSHHYHDVTHLLPDHGITVQGVELDLKKVMKRKDGVVRNLTRGIAGLFKKNKVQLRTGTGRLLADKRVEVTSMDGNVETIVAGHIIVATGSTPVSIPVARADGDRIVDNAGALAFTETPTRLGIIGAGVIGLELGSVWSRFGSEVVVLEALPDFLAAADSQIAQAAKKSLTKQGLDIRMSCRVTGTTVTETGVLVTYQDSNGESSLEVDKLIVAVGRRPNTEGLGAAEVGLTLDDGGRIVVDEHCRTNMDGVYAIGDVVTGPMLAHKASEEGIAVAEMIAGQSAHIDHSIVPWVIYTHPEIAWVGKTVAQAETDGIEVRVGTFPYLASGRAQGAGQTEGLVKMVACAKTDRIIGVHIFGANASELITEAVTAMAFHASSEDIARIVHAHPTLSESLHEAALAVDGRAIHI
jgi:dihydrolipoamide dehydrogenase